MKVMYDLRSELPIQAIGIKKPEKKSGLQRDPGRYKVRGM